MADTPTKRNRQPAIGCGGCLATQTVSLDNQEYDSAMCSPQLCTRSCKCFLKIQHSSQGSSCIRLRRTANPGTSTCEAPTSCVFVDQLNSSCGPSRSVNARRYCRCHHTVHLQLTQLPNTICLICMRPCNYLVSEIEAQPYFSCEETHHLTAAIAALNPSIQHQAINALAGC